ncbi:hypothetical protein FRX31_005188 [Thalictrum thalictroides]|uniref:Uncharacterized protein n=1 Tax=Thalictrum thalictroides TaxID=46969 RepID=A0A7J6X8P0_THATH|nr:hypothetical protein FRX31_005188 [Thalictrum thalictroides]
MLAYFLTLNDKWRETSYTSLYKVVNRDAKLKVYEPNFDTTADTDETMANTFDRMELEDKKVEEDTAVAEGEKGATVEGEQNQQVEGEQLEGDQQEGE